MRNDNGQWVFWGLILHAIIMCIGIVLVVEYEKMAFRNAMQEMRQSR